MRKMRADQNKRLRNLTGAYPIHNKVLRFYKGSGIKVVRRLEN
jgi:hypothetical protein